MRPMVSIIIPVYNRADKILYTLQSAVNQIYNNFEIVIIDDGSTDDTRSVVNKFINDNGYNNLHYYYQNNAGVSIARNNGIGFSKGEYICFLDSDDYLFPNKLEKQISEMEPGDDLSVASFEFFDVDNNCSTSRTIERFYDDVVEDYLANKCKLHTSSYLINRNILLKHNIKFREGCSWGEDVEFFVKVLLKSESVRYTEAVLHKYIFSTNESLSTFNNKKITQEIFIWNQILEWLKENTTNQKYLRYKKLIQGWRLPMALLCTLLNCKNNKDIFFIQFKSCQMYLKKMNWSNGLRSLKWRIIYFYLIIIYYSCCIRKFF